MRMSVSPQDSEPIRLSSEDERVDQSGASNNGKKICFEFALCGAERDQFCRTSVVEEKRQPSQLITLVHRVQ